MGTGANPISTISGADSAKQYGYVDPTGAASSLASSLYGQNGAVSGSLAALAPTMSAAAGGGLNTGFLDAFNKAAPGIAGTISGMSGPLAQTLSGTANYMANNALNATASNFANAGALGSGAASQAFGQALANPFAQAQAQLQGSQLQAGGGALSSLLGATQSAQASQNQTLASVLGSGTQAGGDMASTLSGLVAPQNYTNPQFASQNNLTSSLLTGGLGILGSALGGPMGGALGGALAKGITGKGAATPATG